MTSPSYHDIHVETEKTPRTSIFNLPYNVKITCTRVGGWELWCYSDFIKDYELIAGEYAKEGVRIDVNGHVIVDSLKKVEIQSQVL